MSWFIIVIILENGPLLWESHSFACSTLTWRKEKKVQRRNWEILPLFIEIYVWEYLEAAKYITSHGKDICFEVKAVEN